MTKILGAVTALALVSLPTTARAQSFGQRGDFAFSAERLMGVYLVNEDPEKVTLFGLGITAGAPGNAAIYGAARLGFDGFVTHHLSIGGALAYWSVHDRRNGGGRSGVLFAPRIGWAIDFSQSFGFWPRGGLTYRNFEGNNGDELALTVEGLFYAAPAPHFAFIFGPAFDIGLVGDHTQAQSFGLLTAGILGWI
jgi:hypothetical protein